MEDKKIFSVWLSSVNGIGYKNFVKLVEYFGSPEEVYKASREELSAFLGNGKIYNNIIEAQKYDPAKYMEKLEKLNINVITLDCDEYPNELKNIFDPPPVLYVRGDIKPQDHLAVAIVGSRNATSYGRHMAEKISYELAQKGVTIVSGMARGIDSFSHKGALKAKGRTIAVLGCGINIPYPKENEKLMYEIIENGAVISEFPLNYAPLPGNFPARNRIISGLSLGVLVVEAGIKSGSLITVKFALEQGREIFAIPGNATSAYSKGTNELIKQGAKLVNSVNDILEEFNLRIDIKERINDSTINTLKSEEKKIYEYISNCPRDINEIIEYSGLQAGKVNYILSILIMKDLIIKMPGNKYEKKIF